MNLDTNVKFDSIKIWKYLIIQNLNICLLFIGVRDLCTHFYNSNKDLQFWLIMSHTFQLLKHFGHQIYLFSCKILDTF